jgi:hypothetical protein
MPRCLNLPIGRCRSVAYADGALASTLTAFASRRDARVPWMNVPTPADTTQLIIVTALRSLTPFSRQTPQAGGIARGSRRSNAHAAMAQPLAVPQAIDEIASAPRLAAPSRSCRPGRSAINTVNRAACRLFHPARRSAIIVRSLFASPARRCAGLSTHP